MQQLKEFFEQGGFFMYVNLLCSVVVVTLIVDRAMFFLGKGAVNARAFLEQLRKLLSAGQLEKAQRLAQSSDAPIALVAKAGLSKLKNGEAAVSTAGAGGLAIRSNSRFSRRSAKLSSSCCLLLLAADRNK